MTVSFLLAFNTNEQAMNLLAVAKMVFDANVLQQSVTIKTAMNIKFKCQLKSLDENSSFLLSVQQGLHESLKVSLHLQENASSPLTAIIPSRL